jgi:hypothetical protein
MVDTELAQQTERLEKAPQALAAKASKRAAEIRPGVGCAEIPS